MITSAAAPVLNNCDKRTSRIHKTGGTSRRRMQMLHLDCRRSCFTSSPLLSASRIRSFTFSSNGFVLCATTAISGRREGLMP